MSSMVLGTRAAVVRETVAELADQAIDPRDLLHEVARRVRRVVPYDRASWAMTDFETLLDAELVVAEPSRDCVFNLETAQAELIAGEVNRFAALDRSGRSVATLFDATGGDAAASARHRDVLAPRGLHDELRLLARSGDATWGTAALARASDVPPFSPDERRFLASIASHLGRGLRNGLARGPLAAPARGEPGMLVLGADSRLEAATGEARRWLARMRTPSEDASYVPLAIDLVAMQAQAVARGARAIRPARLRVRIPGEGWLVVHADALDDVRGAPPRTVVLLKPAGRAEMQPLLLALYGLTARERAVTELLLAGRSIEGIAARLSLSRHTVRDYTKSIFAKTGVGSRPELTAILGTDARAA